MKVDIHIVDKILITLFGVFVAAVIGGTIVWIIWPYVIPIIFPELVAKGFIIAKLDWWTSVLLNWLCGCLFRVAS